MPPTVSRRHAAAGLGLLAGASLLPRPAHANLDEPAHLTDVPAGRGTRW